MTWKVLTPAQTAPGSYSKPIATASCSAQCKAEGRGLTPNHTRRAFLRVTLFPARLSGGCPWWTAGGMVQVALGEGLDKGKLLVSRGDPRASGFKLAAHNSGKGGAVLYLADVPGMPPKGHKLTPIVATRHAHEGPSGVAVVFELPAWMRAAAPFALGNPALPGATAGVQARGDARI